MDKLLNFILQNMGYSSNDFKLVGVVYNEQTNTSTFKFIYQNIVVTTKDKEKIIQLLNEYYKNSFNVDCKIKKSYLDEDVIKEFIFRLLNEHASSIPQINKHNDILVDINKPSVNVSIIVFKQYYEYLIHKKLDELIKKQCNENFFADFNVNFTHKDADASLDKALQENFKKVEKQLESFIDNSTPKFIPVNNVEKILGYNCTSENATIISSIKSELDQVQICGKVDQFLTRSFIPKKANANGEFIEKKYYTFTLNDGSGEIKCIYFPYKAEEDKEFVLENGMNVVVTGKTELYNENINMRVKGISSCDFEPYKEKIKFKQVNAEYLYVYPEPYISHSQANFFDVEEKPNEFLKQNEIVVFDVETTGFDATENEIIEIGAVKLKEGKMVEVFSTFIKPVKPIPSEITQLTSITNEMVENAPSVNQAMPDFYKFCHNCVLVAYNIDFDYKFINAASTKCGYKFTNRQVDALYLARLNVAGAKNFQLKSIATKLGVTLDGAHRAINDAIATAEVLKLISYNVPAN